MNQHDTKIDFSTLTRAMRAALQWRLLLLWLVTLAIPTLIVTLPLRKALGSLLDHSVHSLDWARHFDFMAMGDVMTSIGRYDGAAIGGASTVALLLTLLLSPFLTGMMITAVRAAQRASLGELVHGGIAEYWRLFRLMLWSLIPYGFALAIGMLGLGLAKKHAETAVLESSADHVRTVFMILLVVLLVLAHIVVESGRAQIAADSSQRSAGRALLRGASMLWRRPLATLGMYLGACLVGSILFILLGMLRIHIDAVGFFGVLVALIVAQLLVIVQAWERGARLFALADVAGDRTKTH